MPQTVPPHTSRPSAYRNKQLHPRKKNIIPNEQIIKKPNTQREKRRKIPINHNTLRNKKGGVARQPLLPSLPRPLLLIVNSDVL